ncbi:MAG TPA: gamma-glutamyltransferase [Parvularculaceae bacterium]|nr:gamma-glutamyltransferase [Parvularculaceae bacterium]
MRCLLSVLAALIFVSSGALAAASKEGPPKHYFIAAANPYAVDAGAKILEEGGTAVDAAIATQAVLSLVEPQSSGLGGGAFMLYYDPATRAVESYDGREVAPASATPNRFLHADGTPMDFREAVIGGLSVGVPGVVKMLELAHEDHGKFPWKTLLGPARKLAEDGFTVSPRLNMELAGEAGPLNKMSPAAEYFYDKDGKARPVGYRLKNPAYAHALSILMKKGPEAFYSGEIAEAIVKADNGGPQPGGMTLDDLKNYRAVKREPVCGPYRAYEICSMAPPSSGGITLLQMLGLLQRFDLAGAGAGSIEALHLYFEASKLAYADRNKYLADQDQAAAEGGPTQEALAAALLNPAYLKARAATISKTAAAKDVEAGDPWKFTQDPSAGKWKVAPGVSPEPPSTSHFVIVDGEGRVVSMTTTVESAFGSHLMAEGMILNNQLTDFSFIPERDGVPVANAVAPGKRPRSSMTPVIMFDSKGKLYGAVGSPGGPAIIGYVAKTLIAVIDWGMSMQQAIDYPNIVYPRGAPVVEKGGFDPQILAGLKAMGHPVIEYPLTSGLHGLIVKPDGTYDGGADKRREGTWKTGVVKE